MSNRFVFVVPAFQAEKTIQRMLMSVFLQTWDNWVILIRDDLSHDNTVEIIKSVCERNGVPHMTRWRSGKAVRSVGQWDEKTKPKVIVDVNNEKFWEVKNVLAMINDPVVQEDDIICRLDGDDFIVDLCALEDINTVYDLHKCDALWTAHRWHGSGRNISGPMPENVDVYKHPWVSSHLKTFRKSLITDVNDENFRGEDGNYIRRTGDQAIYLPVLHRAKKRLFFPRCMYYYQIDDVPATYDTPDSKFQRSEGEFLRARGFVS